MTRPSSILKISSTCFQHLSFIIPMLVLMRVGTANTQVGPITAHYQGTFEAYNKFGLPSLIVPVPCQANVLQEQVNYICAHGNIWCLPGWKVT